MEQQSLQDMLVQGMSLQEIARTANVNRTTVRYYIKKYNFSANHKPGNKQIADNECRCVDCGDTNRENFYINNKYRCKKCEVRRVSKYRSSRKYKEVEKRGGCCSLCGYNKCVSALEFHHLDPSEKEFQWDQLTWKSQQIIDTELEKCILVCSNCHRELHHAAG